MQGMNLDSAHNVDSHYVESLYRRYHAVLCPGSQCRAAPGTFPPSVWRCEGQIVMVQVQPLQIEKAKQVSRLLESVARDLEDAKAGKVYTREEFNRINGRR